MQNPSLTAIEFSDTWSEYTANGIFGNLAGHNVQFTLDTDSPTITTEFPVGEYRLLQVHMHWGSSTGTGSEHRFDGNQNEVEIHFVHQRVSQEGQTDRNGYAVIGVYAKVNETAPVSGFWSTFNISGVTNVGDNVTVTNFALSSILPPDLNSSYYYYYEGGLTTPPCTESVQFYLLRQRIKVPGAYLTSLRSIRDKEGNVLSMNYRDVQPLNGRKVQIPGGSSASIGASVVVVAVLALLATLAWL